MTAASSQVSELSSPSKEEDSSSIRERQLADLQQHRRAKGRHVLAEAGERRQKYELETGILRDGTIGKPLEPWTAPGSYRASMYLYGRIMNADPGAFNVAEFAGSKLAQVHWMAQERLIAVDEDLRIHPLSDAEAPARRAYPGAKVSDKRASIGHYLRDHAVGLVAAALFNHSAGRLRRRTARLAELVGEGLRATVALICAEANRIKSKRADLAEFRYLSVTRCAEIVRALIETGFLDEIEPTKFTRRERSWRTIVRVIRRILKPFTDEEIATMTELVAKWDADRRKVKAEISDWVMAA